MRRFAEYSVGSHDGMQSSRRLADARAILKRVLSVDGIAEEKSAAQGRGRREGKHRVRCNRVSIDGRGGNHQLEEL